MDPQTNYSKTKVALVLDYLPYFRNVSYTLAEYPSSKRKGAYEIRARITPFAACTQLLSPSALSAFGLSLPTLNKLTTQGLTLQRLNVGVSVLPSAAPCNNCTKNRAAFLDLDADLLQTAPQLWLALRRLHTGDSPLLASSSENDSKTVAECFASSLQLFAP